MSDFQHSEQLVNLATALAAAQADIRPAAFDSTNPFLKNRFASLGAVIDAVTPAMAAHGLSVVQLPVSDGDRIGLRTVILHSSGEWLAGEMSLPLGEEKGKSLAQVAGSIITYLRRYALSAALRVYAEEDTDAQEPTNGGTKVKAKPEPKAMPTPKAEPTPKVEAKPVAANQFNAAMHTRFSHEYLHAHAEGYWAKTGAKGPPSWGTLMKAESCVTWMQTHFEVEHKTNEEKPCSLVAEWPVVKAAAEEKAPEPPEPGEPPKCKSCQGAGRIPDGPTGKPCPECNGDGFSDPFAEE